VSILFVLIPLGLLLLGIAVWAFVWAVNHEQFEDLDRAASSILFEDESPSAPLREDESPPAPLREDESPPAPLREDESPPSPFFEDEPAPPRDGFADPPEGV
jgi:cbb3-type cytochrome oxidase maturation protein